MKSYKSISDVQLGDLLFYYVGDCGVLGMVEKKEYSVVGGMAIPLFKLCWFDKLVDNGTHTFSNVAYYRAGYLEYERNLYGENKTLTGRRSSNF